MSLAATRTLGRSGLAVSPLALGTMTFGTARWGAPESHSREIFNAYTEAGGNFVDTANVYANGRSEEMLGTFIAERQLRNEIVLATKAGFATTKGPHAGGNGAKHLHTAVESSLRRLQTDHIDLFWIHVWDGITPAEELLQTLTTLTQSGKIRYYGFSNTPAWYVAKLATLAHAHNTPAPIALQYFYSLVNRDIEEELVPLAKEFGLAILPWSPLAAGFLTGKYTRETVESAPKLPPGTLPRDAASPTESRPETDNRLDGPNPFGASFFTDRNWKILETLTQIAAETNHPPAQIALAWAAARPAITSLIIGASRPEQIPTNIAALNLTLSPEHHAALNAISAPDPRLIYTLAQPAMRQNVIFGGASVTGWGE